VANEGCFLGGYPQIITHVKILVVTVPCPVSTIESEVVKILAMFAVLKGGGWRCDFAGLDIEG